MSKLWEVRKTRLGEIPQELRAEREAKGLDAMLRLALGHPAPGNPLQHDLNTLENRLNSPYETVSADMIHAYKMIATSQKSIADASYLIQAKQSAMAIAQLANQLAQVGGPYGALLAVGGGSP